MARAVNRLSARAVQTATRAGYHPDGAGLYLQVSATGAKSWIFRYTIRGKSREMGLGPLSLVPLADARERAAICRRQLLDDIDPIAERDRARAAQHARTTFEACAQAYIEAHRTSWRNAKHAAQWDATLNTYAASMLPMAVDDIDTAAVVGVLTPIWNTKTETATRVRQRIEAVLDWAAVRGMRTGENPARWRGHLAKLLPAPTRLKKVTNRRALPYADVPAFMEALRAKQTTAARALELVTLTATRPNEAAAATWAEFDLDAGVWVIPAERMKAGRAHRVPLAPGLVEMLRQLPLVDDEPFVFPGGRRGRPITTAAMLKQLNEIRPGVHTHGFRSTFRDWAADCTSYAREIAEQALAHTLESKVEAVYRRTDLFDKRRSLMSDWATYCVPGGAHGLTQPLA